MKLSNWTQGSVHDPLGAKTRDRRRLPEGVPKSDLSDTGVLPNTGSKNRRKKKKN